MKKNISTDELQQQLISITRQLLNDFGEGYQREVRMDTSLQRHLSIDSLGRAELFQRFEKTFKVSFPDSLLASADTLQDVATFIEQADTHQIIKPKKRIITLTHGEHASVIHEHFRTLQEILHRYAQVSPNKPHIYFQREDGSEEIITYGDLYANALKVAQGLKDRGIYESDKVAIMQPTSPDFFYAFFGTLLAGAVPVPIYPPFRMHMLEAYAKTEARILTNAEVRILITFTEAEKLSYLLKSFVPSLKEVTNVPDLLTSQPLSKPVLASAEDIAFIQYTSGSTNDPKGVVLTHMNLLANIQAYGKTIQVKPDDVTVSWLPLYHDMGLIGMWLGSLYFGIPLVLLTPFAFLNHPEKWLWAIHYHRGTLSGAPNFAYELCLRKIDPAQIEGLDLSSWRLAANGAEKVYPRTLEKFTEKFAPYGFKRRAMLPVYGLAESTVALAIPPLERDFRVDHVDRKAFEEQRLAKTQPESADSLAFVACGKAMVDHAMRIVDDQGNVLPERHVGHLQFQGPSSMQGYYNNAEATQAIYHDGWWQSGDLAYIAEDEVFITGRSKDLIIKAGRNIYPAEVEELVGAVPGVRQGCVAAFEVAKDERGTEQLVIVAETRETQSDKRQNLRNAINEAVASTLDMVPDQVVLVKPHIVPKTSSGKLQRAACKKLYLAGKLSKTQVPAWLQITKLGTQTLLKNVWHALQITGRFFYTAYVLILFLISLVPAYFLVRFTSRETGARVCQIWAKFMLLFSGCIVHVKGKEILSAIKEPVIFTANHASYIDTVVMLAILPPATRYVGKKELFSTPVLRTFMRKLGHLEVDRMDLSKGLRDTQNIQQSLTSGIPVMIFPEGTFGYSSGLRPFRLGAFKIAADGEYPVCPVALQGTRAILRDEEKLMSPGNIYVTVSPFVYASGKEWQDITRLRHDVRTKIAEFCGEPTLDLISAKTVAPKKSELV